jgi:hypothetical protein
MAKRNPEPPARDFSTRAPARRRLAAAALETDYRREVGEASTTLKLAEDLFVELVVKQHAESANTSPTRIAVSCLLLEQICAVFARYHTVLASVAEIIMRSVYVPNTAENRELLGSVTCPLQLPATLPPEAQAMLEPYARKTYVQAYSEISDALARYSRSNRNIEIRLSRQTKVFDQTMRHWMSSIVRNFFVSWRGYTKRRHQLRAKYRAVFYRVRSDECKVKAIRLWRDRAARVKKAAMVDAASADELQAITVSVAHMQAQVDTLTQYNGNLGKQIAEQEARRQQLQTEIDERERLTAEMQTRAVEVERLGTELLESTLFARMPPNEPTAIEVLVKWANGVIAATGGAIDGTVDPLLPLLLDEYLVEVPFSALASVMMGFAGDRAPSREAVVQLHLDSENAPSQVVAMYERLTGRTCVVSDEQLATSQRGVTLIFLASLMRFATTWLLCPQPSPAGSYSLPPKPTAGPLSWQDRVAIQQQWIFAAMAAQNAALVLAVQHPVALSAEEADDQRRFLDVPLASIADLLPLQHADRRHLELMKAVRKVYVDVRNLYVAYATPTMTFTDLTRLLKDCYMMGERKLTRRNVESICRAAWRLDWGQAFKSEDGLGGAEISKSQFTEVLLRICHTELKRTSPDTADIFTGKHFVTMVTERLAAHALRSNVDKFKQVVRHPHVQSILAKHRISLRRVFRKYATCDDGEGINRASFQQMARDCDWISRNVTVEAINEIFKRVQAVEAGSADSLDLSEWLECLCAIAVYHNPNPFAPLAAKLGGFLEERVLTLLAM